MRVARVFTIVFAMMGISCASARAGSVDGGTLADPPELPTFEEAGVPDFRIANWYGILVPAGTPKAVIAKLSEEIRRGVNIPAIRARLEGALLEPAAKTPEEFQRMLETDASRWLKLVKDAGVRVD